MKQNIMLGRPPFSPFTVVRPRFFPKNCYDIRNIKDLLFQRLLESRGCWQIARVLVFHLSSLFLFPLHRSFPLHCRHVDFVTTFRCFQALKFFFKFFFFFDPTDPKLGNALDGKRRKKWDGRRNLLSMLGPLLLFIYPKIREILIGSQMDHKITENAFKNYRVTLEIILSPFETR